MLTFEKNGKEPFVASTDHRPTTRAAKGGGIHGHAILTGLTTFDQLSIGNVVPRAISVPCTWRYSRRPRFRGELPEIERLNVSHSGMFFLLNVSLAIHPSWW
jgi:hypothetical protein